jgi:hypothetical protein
LLTVNGPTSIVADPGTDEPIIQASAASDYVAFDPPSGNDIHIGGLSLTNGAYAAVPSLGAARSATNYRLLVIGAAGATVAPTYTIDSTSTLDLADNDMAILYGSGATPMPMVTAELSQSYDGGLWNQRGLTSSVARVNAAAYGLGYAEASALGVTSFDGVNLGGNAVLVKYTRLGDANLDGSVNFNDFSIVQNHFGQAGGWSSGDFNYDGTVNFNDFSILQNNYGTTAESAQVVGSSLAPTAMTTRPNTRAAAKLFVDTSSATPSASATTAAVSHKRCPLRTTHKKPLHTTQKIQ